MGLESKVREGGNLIETGVDLATSVFATIGAYNLAGHICTIADYSDTTEKLVVAATLSAGAILGYKARSIFKKIEEISHKTKRKLKKRIARTKIIREISKDKEFQGRMGIETGQFSTSKKGLKYLLTVPLGGALGYFPGAVGIIPLCVYFGEHYKWSIETALNSGTIAGPLVGVYAFAEMSAKKQYKRLTTTAFALAGISAGHFINQNLNLAMIDDKSELWAGLGICAASGAVAGAVGNLVYKKVIDR